MLSRVFIRVVHAVQNGRCPAGRTFCSRYLLEALQTTGRPEFIRHDPTTTTPSALYKILREHGKEFIHVSEKRMERALRTTARPP
jgi:hypothetical protein